MYDPMRQFDNVNVRGVSNTVLLLLLIITTPSFSQNLDASPNRQSVDLPLSDPWEHRPPRNFDYKSCSTINQDLIVPVITAKRQKAVALLENVQIIPLDDENSSEFGGTQNSSASKLIGARIAQMERQRDLAINEHKGSWSRTSQMQLDELLALSRNLPALTAFLVRAVVKNEATGLFGAKLCGTSLFVSHLSLGDTVPKSTRVPILVFLDHSPSDVYVTTGMAR